MPLLDGHTNHRRFDPTFTVDFTLTIALLQGFVHAYADILRAGASAFSTIFQHLVHAPSACLVHCTAGKDRTGVFVALILSLLGCSDEVVAHEYALTDQGLAHKKPVFIERLLQTEALKGNRKGVENMVGAR